MGKRAVEENEEEVAAAALAAKKAAKKAKKAAAAAAEAAQAEEEEAAALAARKAAKKAKKAAAAAAAEPEAEEEDPEAAALAAKKAAKKAKKAAAAAAAAAEEEEEAPAPKKKKIEEAAPAPKKEEAKKEDGEEEWKDRTLHCMDCDKDFEWSIGEQQFHFEKGFDGEAKRCKDCRWAKKNAAEGGDGKGKGKKGKDGGGKGGHDNENTAFVRGLPFSTTEEALNKDFGECGEIVSLRMPLNDEGSCKGIAFIKYTAKEGMDKAIAFNETDYGGRTIYCAAAADNPGGKGKGKDGKGKDGKGKGKDGKGKKGKKGKASSEAFAKNTGAMVESTGTKQTFADSDEE